MPFCANPLNILEIPWNSRPCIRYRSAAVGRCLLLLVGALSLVAPRTAGAQGLTGTLIGTIADDQGAVIAGVLVQLRSPALIGGPLQQLTNTQGRLWFVALPPGPYVLEVSFKGFSTARVDDIVITAGATLERIVRLSVADRAESVVVDADGSRIEARHPGFGTWLRRSRRRATACSRT